MTSASPTVLTGQLSLAISSRLSRDGVEAMVRVDVAGWMTPNPRTLPALIKFGTHGGARLALLSNAPEPLAKPQPTIAEGAP